MAVLTLATGPAAECSAQIWSRIERTYSAVLVSMLPYPTIDLVGTGRGLATAPDSLAAGRHLVRLTAASSVSSSVHFLRFPVHLDLDTATDLFLTAAAMDVLPGAGWTFAGGSWADPGSTVSFVVELTPGIWHIGSTISWPGTDGSWQEVPALIPVTVTGAAIDRNPDPRPPAGLRIELDDFAFVGLDSPVPAGPVLWEITATGHAERAMVLFRTTERIGQDEFVDGLSDAMAGRPPSAGSPLTRISRSGYTGLLSPGQTMHAEFDLSPGEHIATSWIVDPSTQLPALALGMYQEFAVLARSDGTTGG